MPAIQWVKPLPPETPLKDMNPTHTSAQSLRGWLVSGDVAVALRITESVPCVWTVEACILEALPERGHMRPTSLCETVHGASVEAVRAEGEMLAHRLLASWSRGAVA